MTNTFKSDLTKMIAEAGTSVYIRGNSVSAVVSARRKRNKPDLDGMWDDSDLTFMIVGDALTPELTTEERITYKNKVYVVNEIVADPYDSTVFVKTVTLTK